MKMPDQKPTDAQPATPPQLPRTPDDPPPVVPGQSRSPTERLVREQMDRLGDRAGRFAKEKVVPVGHAATDQMRKAGWKKAALWLFGIALGLGFLSMMFGGGR